MSVISDFIKSLTTKYEDGGVEIEERAAKRMASVADKVLSQANDIKRYRSKDTNTHAFFSQHQLAERMRDHLLKANRMKLSTKQDANLADIIADRVQRWYGPRHSRLGRSVDGYGRRRKAHGGNSFSPSVW